MFSLLFALCALAVFAAPLKSSFSSFSSSARVAMESEARNKHWTLLRSHSAHSAHSLLLSSRLHILQFWLHAQNASGVERELSLRSDPHSPLFRHWLSVDEANKFLLPKNEHLERVLSWIDTFDNIRNVSVSLNVVFVETTVGVAEKMLATKFSVFSHKTHSDVTIVRAIDSYSLPADIAEAVAFVGGVRHFPRSVPKIVATKKRSPEFGVAITPRIIHERYGSVGVANKAANNSQAVAQFLGQVFREADLQEFFLLHSPENIGRRPTIIGPDGGLFGGTEAELDIQYIFAVGQSVSTIFWSTPGLKDGQEPFLTWINAVAAYRNPPLVNSVSYGDDEDSLSVSFMNSINTVFASLGVRGLSFLFASGDSGVGGDSSCGPQGQFVPSYPAGSPYVTAVGGTTLSKPFERGNEVAWSGSGGGFSNIFQQPAWQKNAVQTYLSKSGSNLPPSNLYNATGRAYPDVAAFSTGFSVVVDLIPQPVDGTSCATPTFSGIISLVNGARLAKGKSALGFLNPWLYQIQNSALTDVTEGANPNCNSNGFICTKGWDPVTGWGSPVYPKLAAQALAEP